MLKLAQAVLLTAEIREKSWNPKKLNPMRFTPGDYELSIEQAAVKAAEQVGYDTRGTRPISLLLYCSWNDVLDWANEVINPKTSPQNE